MSNASSSWTTTSMLDAPTVASPHEDWSGVITSSQVLYGILLVVNIWVLMSTVIYGFKTNRWRKRPGTSSLTTGAVFNACVIAIVLKLPDSILAQVWLYMAKNPSSMSNKCEGMIDALIFVDLVSLDAVYTFLWMVQRKILKHPYIKDRVNKYVNYFSRGLIVVITMLFAGLLVLLLIDRDNFEETEDGCAVNPDKADTVKAIGLMFTACLVAVQIIFLSLSMYAASRAITPRTSENGQYLDGGEESVPCEKQEEVKSHNCCKIFIKNITKNTSRDHPTGPIHMAVRRSSISSLIIFGGDLLFNLISLFAIPDDAPIFVHYSFGYIQLFIHIFAMLAVLGIAGNVLTLCCPKVSKVRLRKSRSIVVRPKEPAIVVTPVT